MAGINIQNIVEINFNIKQATQPLSSYSTVAYVIKDAGTFTGTKVYTGKIKSYIDEHGNPTDGLPAGIIQNINHYFSFGGRKLLVTTDFITVTNTYEYDEFAGYTEFTLEDDYVGYYIEESANSYVLVTEDNKSTLDITPGTTVAYTQGEIIDTTVQDNLLTLKQSKYGTDEDFIYVVPHFNTNGFTYGEVEAAENIIATYKSPYKIRFLETVTSIPDINSTPYNKECVARKYSPANFIFKDEPNVGYGYPETALSIGAYFSNVYIYGENMLKDYCYTNENDFIAPNGIPDITQSEYDALNKAYISFDGRIGTQYYNFGGDLTNGTSLAIDFGGLACENAITRTVLEQILAKQYLTQGGLTNIVNAINAELNKFVVNGYIEQNSIFNDETITIVYDKQYTVISRGEHLPTGYKIFTIPMSNLLPEDKKAKRFTPIYIVLMTVAGARTIKIDGDIIA